jgi:hypothetical protein
VICHKATKKKSKGEMEKGDRKKKEFFPIPYLSLSSQFFYVFVFSG